MWIKNMTTLPTTLLMSAGISLLFMCQSVVVCCFMFVVCCFPWANLLMFVVYCCLLLKAGTYNFTFHLPNVHCAGILESVWRPWPKSKCPFSFPFINSVTIPILHLCQREAWRKNPLGWAQSWGSFNGQGDLNLNVLDWALLTKLLYLCCKRRVVCSTLNMELLWPESQVEASAISSNSAIIFAHSDG